VPRHDGDEGGYAHLGAFLEDVLEFFSCEETGHKRQFGIRLGVDAAFVKYARVQHVLVEGCKLGFVFEAGVVEDDDSVWGGESEDVAYLVRLPSGKLNGAPLNAVSGYKKAMHIMIFPVAGILYDCASGQTRSDLR